MTGPRRYKRDGIGRFARSASSGLAGQKAAPSARRSSPARKPSSTRVGSGGLRVASGTVGRPPRVGPRADVSVNVGLRSVEVSGEKRLPVARGRVQVTARAGLRAELVKR